MESNRLTRESNEQNRDILIYTLEMYKALQRAKPNRLEAVVQRQVVDVEGGIVQYRIEPGLIADIVTDKEVIEIKHVGEWKAGLGQVTLYADLLPTRKKRLHLFAKPFDRLPSPKAKEKIEVKCSRAGVTVTWHKWQQPRRPTQIQGLLPI